MQLFYCKEIGEGFCTLDAEESRHAVRVLRLKEGDAVHVTDGQGALMQGVVAVADERACTVQIVCVERRDVVQAGLHLAVAPTKNPSRMEWLVEKAVEVGVGEITLLQCDHSERVFMKTDRLERLAVSAMKQSLHTVLPRINPVVKLRDWFHSPLSTLHSPLKLIAHCEAGQPRTPIAEVLLPGRNATILIGPEGDFSPEEIDMALHCGYVPVSLGPSRLRTETAALYAACAFNLINDK